MCWRLCLCVVCSKLEVVSWAGFSFFVAEAGGGRDGGCVTVFVDDWAPEKGGCVLNGAFATPKQQGPEGRTGPAGHGPQCLTLLSEPTRKLALWAICLPAAKAHKRPRRLTNGAFATPKQQGPEGRTGPAGHGPQCLTLLSEPTRKLALWAVCLPAAKAHKRRLRHTETAGPWRTDRACGPRPPVPNVAFWTDKKTSSLSCLSSTPEGSQTAPSPHRNSRALKDGPGLRATAPSA